MPRSRASPRVASASASNSGRRSGVRSATASRWRATVASSPRAIGPVSASAAPSARPVLDRGADERDEQRAVDAGGGGEPLRRALERDEEVRRDRGGRVVGGAVLVGDGRRAQAEPRGQLARDRERARRRARDGGAGARERRRAGRRDGHQRVQAERLVAGERRRARSRPSSGRPARRARRPRRRPRSRRPARTAAPRRRRPGSRHGRAGRRSARPVARRAAARAVPRRPAPTIAQRGEVSGVPVQFSHGDTGWFTASVDRANCWFAGRPRRGRRYGGRVASAETRREAAQGGLAAGADVHEVPAARRPRAPAWCSAPATPTPT